jgi:hypothetical protein
MLFLESISIINSNVILIVNFTKAPPQLACRAGHIEVVKHLLNPRLADRVGLNTKTKKGWTGLMWACDRGHADIVQLFLNCHKRVWLREVGGINRDGYGFTYYTVYTYDLL